MKILRSSIFRAVCAIVTGILLINNPDSTVKWITVAIGVMFLLSGAISLATYFNARKRSGANEIYDAEGRLIVQARPTFPVVGLGSVLLGLTLAVIPGVFIKTLMYALGGIIILGSINQFMTLLNAKKMFRVPVWFWIGPSLILITGVFIIIRPIDASALPLLIIGWCLLFYGVTEFINAVKIYKETRNQVRINDGIN